MRDNDRLTLQEILEAEAATDILLETVEKLSKIGGSRNNATVARAGFASGMIICASALLNCPARCMASPSVKSG